MSSLEDIAKVMAYLAAAFPRVEVKKETVRVYHDLLGDLPLDVLQAAAKQVAVSSAFFPAASELRKTAQELQARARGELTAEEAWSAVSRAMARWGSYGEPLGAEDGWGYRMPRELDALTLRAVEAVGGWRMLCSSEQPGVERAHFLRLYDGLQRAERGEATMLPAVREVVNRLADAMRMPRLVTPGEVDHAQR